MDRATRTCSSRLFSIALLFSVFDVVLSVGGPPQCFSSKHSGRLLIDLGSSWPFYTTNGERAFLEAPSDGYGSDTQTVGKFTQGDESVCTPVGASSLTLRVMQFRPIGDNTLLGTIEVSLADDDRKWELSKNGQPTNDFINVKTWFYPALRLCEFYDSLQTGDVVLFSGASWKGDGIKFLTGAEFSHIGLVYREPEDPTLYILESSTNGAKLQDCRENKALQGVELLSLRDKVFSGSYSSVAFRKIKGLDDTARATLHRSLSAFYHEKRGTPYPDMTHFYSAFEFAGTVTGWNYKEDDNTLFCSEFVALAFKAAGMLKQQHADVYSNNFKPSDFESSANEGDDYGQKLIYELGSEIYMRDPQLFGLQEALPNDASPSTSPWNVPPQCAYRTGAMAGCQCGVDVPRASEPGVPRCDGDVPTSVAPADEKSVSSSGDGDVPTSVATADENSVSSSGPPMARACRMFQMAGLLFYLAIFSI